MHAAFVLLGPFVPLGVLIVSDWRRRCISVAWLAITAGVSFVSALLCFGGTLVAARLATNLPFLALLYGGLWFYLRLVRRRERAIGLGDLLFLPLLTPFFDLYGFVLFLTGSFGVSLLGYGFVFSMTKQKTRSVPLVSTVGSCFLIYLTVRLWMI